MMVKPIVSDKTHLICKEQVSQQTHPHQTDLLKSENHSGARRVDDIQQVQLVCHDGKPHSQAEDGNQKVHTNDLISPGLFDRQAIERTTWLKLNLGNIENTHHLKL